MCFGRWLRVELIKIYPMLNEQIAMLHEYVIILWRFSIDTLVVASAFPPKGNNSNTNEHPDSYTATTIKSTPTHP
jgi:hypothetical protein